MYYLKIFYFLKRNILKLFRFINRSTYFIKNILKVIVLIIIIYLFMKGGF